MQPKISYKLLILSKMSSLGQRLIDPKLFQVEITHMKQTKMIIDLIYDPIQI